MKGFVILPRSLQDRLDSLKARAGALEARAAEEDETERRQYLTLAVGGMFEKAATYLAILQAAGYAAFFSIWEGARDYMSRPQNLWCVGMIASSLVLFIVWHVFLNLLLARQQSQLAGVAMTPPEHFKKAVSDFQFRGDKLRVRLARGLLPVNVLILAPAVAGMFVLLYAVALHIYAPL